MFLEFNSTSKPYIKSSPNMYTTLIPIQRVHFGINLESN